MVRFKRFDARFSKSLVPIALAVSTYILPLVLAAAAIKLLLYFLIKNWDTVILKAATNGELSLLNDAIRNKGNIESKQNDTEFTPLMLAAMNNHKSILSALIAAGADVDARDSEGRVALMFASQMGYIDIVQILLAKGSDPDSKGYDGTSPLILAASKSILATADNLFVEDTQMINNYCDHRVRTHRYPSHSSGTGRRHRMEGQEWPEFTSRLLEQL